MVLVSHGIVAWFPYSPLPLSILSEFSQYLSTTKLPDLLDDLPPYLSFIKHAATHTQINPLVKDLMCIICTLSSNFTVER